MRPLVQVQPGPLTPALSWENAYLWPLGSWLLLCLALAQRSKKAFLHRCSVPAKLVIRPVSGERDEVVEEVPGAGGVQPVGLVGGRHHASPVMVIDSHG